MAFTQVLALAPMMKSKRVKEYIRELPEITQGPLQDVLSLLVA